MRARRFGDQLGTSTLEFIVVLPTLLIIFLGGMELSRAWLTANIATNAAREGARVAVAMDPLDPANPSFANAQTAGEARIDEILAAANLTAASRSVACATSACPQDSPVTAIVTMNFVTVTPLFLPMLGTPSNPLVLSEKTIMRRE
jgi:Flp pilus assembly protein TadG